MYYLLYINIIYYFSGYEEINILKVAFFFIFQF